MSDLYFIIRFVHVLGAIAVGYYLLLPFLVSRMGRDSAAVQSGYLKNLFQMNRIGQYILILQFLTGGYMISQYEYSIWWIVLVIVVFVIVGALAGMMSRPMKKLSASLERGESERGQIGKIQTYSTLLAIALIVLVVLMVFPSFR